MICWSLHMKHTNQTTQRRCIIWALSRYESSGCRHVCEDVSILKPLGPSAYRILDYMNNVNIQINNNFTQVMNTSVSCLNCLCSWVSKPKPFAWCMVCCFQNGRESVTWKSEVSAPCVYSHDQRLLCGCSRILTSKWLCQCSELGIMQQRYLCVCMCVSVSLSRVHQWHHRAQQSQPLEVALLLFWK